MKTQLKLLLLNVANLVFCIAGIVLLAIALGNQSARLVTAICGSACFLLAILTIVVRELYEKKLKGIELLLPTTAHEEQIIGFKKELAIMGEKVNGIADLDEIDDYSVWLNFETRQKEKYGENYIPSQTFVAVKKVDGKVVGIATYFSNLNDKLKNSVGNVALTVLPSERNNGYGTQMLKLMLDFCRDKTDNNVLVCCNQNNQNFVKAITKLGGVFESESAVVINEQNPEKILRFSFDLSKK